MCNVVNIAPARRYVFAGLRFFFCCGYCLLWRRTGYYPVRSLCYCRCDPFPTTQTSLAESVGMRQQSVQYLESGRATRTGFILELAKVLKCDPDWLLNGENSEQQKV
ncbi:helix-turn-helix domain-containing protein [Escherichia coli]|uniref:helix-turn-helix domain-containing protein n=1 Tax=Escherichia coli TaxID=562 RepID=UPI0009895BA8